MPKKLDWYGLKNSMKNVKISREPLMAVMPKYSTSVMSNISNGIEPMCFSYSSQEDEKIKLKNKERTKLRNKLNKILSTKAKDGSKLKI